MGGALRAGESWDGGHGSAPPARDLAYGKHAPARLRAANQAITRLVSELSAANASSQTESYSGQIESLTGQLNKIEKVLGSFLLRGHAMRNWPMSSGPTRSTWA